MNPRRIRLALTAWYVLVLLLIVSVMGGVAYLALNRSLSAEVDRSIRSSTVRLADQVRQKVPLAAPTQVRQDSRGEREKDDDHDEGLEYFTGASGDVFYAVLSSDGLTVTNPLNVDLTRLGTTDGVDEARLKGEAWRTVTADGHQYRLLFYAVQRDGRTTAIIEAGRSLEAHHNDLRSLATVLVLTSAGGLMLAVIGGLYVSGRALGPASLAYEKQREFISDASHELRTPLTLIRASAEAIRRGRKSELAREDAESLSDIITESDRMGTLVDDLLMLAKLDEKRLPLRLVDVDMSRLLQETGRRAAAISPDDAATISVDVSPDLHAYADADACRRVVNILLSNAIRYGGKASAIKIQGRSAGTWVEVSVSDSGPGLSAEDLSHVFDRFYRADKSRSSETGGSGLGLAIAKGIVEAHGGRIWVASTLGLGATFTLTLPSTS